MSSRLPAGPRTRMRRFDLVRTSFFALRAEHSRARASRSRERRRFHRLPSPIRSRTVFAQKHSSPAIGMVMLTNAATTASAAERSHRLAIDADCSTWHRPSFRGSIDGQSPPLVPTLRDAVETLGQFPADVSAYMRPSIPRLQDRCRRMPARFPGASAHRQSTESD